MGAAGVRGQPVAPQLPLGGEEFDHALGIRLAARDLARADDPADLLDPAADRAGKVHRGIVHGDGLVLLAHPPLREQLLVGAAVLGADAEHHQARGQPVQPVGRAELGQVQLGAQPGQGRLHDVAAARGRREEVRLVHDQQVLVAVHDADRERHHGLRVHVPVEPQVGARLVRVLGAQDASAGAEDPAARQQPRHGLGAPGAGVALGEVAAEVGPAAVPVGGQPQPDRVDAGDLGQGRGGYPGSASHRSPG